MVSLIEDFSGINKAASADLNTNLTQNLMKRTRILEQINRPSEATLSDVKKSSKRNKELHFRFPEIPNTEKLLHNYICAWGKNGMLLQGRIYVTRHRICFYSSFLNSTNRVAFYLISDYHVF